LGGQKATFISTTWTFSYREIYSLERLNQHTIIEVLGTVEIDEIDGGTIHDPE
jgi:hypothetical protein